MAQKTFERIEKKFLLSSKQYQQIQEAFAPYFHADQYGQYTICNVYFDTEDNCLIRRSLEKPPYKEKMRLRSYGKEVNPDTLFFLEIKKKYKGVVYKRRITLNIEEAEKLLTKGSLPEWQNNASHLFQDQQILQEMQYFLTFYQPKPKLFLGYDRIALAGIEDPELRVTFDTGIRCREQDISPITGGSKGYRILSEDNILMEIKVPGAYPIWMAKALNHAKAYPVSFSKYGYYYENKVRLEQRELSPTLAAVGNIPFTCLQGVQIPVSSHA
jgi:uncharacterized protein YjbK